MAGFCTKCGSALPDGSSFCTGCGTPVGTAVAQAPGAAPPPAAPPQGTSALKIILIIIGVFVGIGVLSGAAILFGVWRISRSVKVDPRSPDRISITTPMGNMTMGTQKEVSEAEVGVPLYPNAKHEEGNLQFSTSEGSMNTYVFKTSDSPAQVIEFYRGKLGSQTSFVETPEGGMITSAKGEKEGFMITVGRDGGKTAITIIRGRTEKAP
jgi:zinc ribbon protein